MFSSKKKSSSQKSPDIFASRFIEIEDHKIYYKEGGEGEALILVHGISGSTRWWSRNAKELSKKYRVYIIDLPGFGAMRSYLSPFSLKESTGWLKSWMDSVGIKKAHFVGHSMGGYICLNLAFLYPSTVDKMILVSPAGIISGRSYLRYFLALLAAVRYIKLSFIPVLMLDSIVAGPITLLSAIQGIIISDFKKEIGSIKNPVLLIWGAHDSLIPPSQGMILKKLIPQSKLLILRNSGHIPMYDQPEEFNTAVLSFLSEK